MSESSQTADSVALIDLAVELRGQIETMLATHDHEEWKTAGLEAMACILRMWLEESIPEMKQENRRLKAQVAALSLNDRSMAP